MQCRRRQHGRGTQISSRFAWIPVLQIDEEEQEVRDMLLSAPAHPKLQ